MIRSLFYAILFQRSIESAIPRDDRITIAYFYYIGLFAKLIYFKLSNRPDILFYDIQRFQII